MKTDRPRRYQLVLEPEPSSIPPILRLRKLLKLALRAFGLKCVSAEEIKAGEEARAVDAEEREQ